jgi:pSer/pThr/pTyr-binding forkhead associated (FHA) protein
VGGSAPSLPKEASSLLETVRRGACLIVSGGAQRGREFALRAAETSIGRDPEADVSIEEPSASRRHALVVRKRDGFYLRDLGSTNGTYLFGVLRGAEKRLMEGDRFRIGRTEFLFHDEPEKPEE